MNNNCIKIYTGGRVKYRKKPVVVEAHQWIENGSHPEDDCEVFFDKETGQPFKGEGKIVRYFRRPDVSGYRVCEKCGLIMHRHGWIDTLEGGHIVCPNDYIIKGIKGEFYPCKPDVFLLSYEKVEE